MRGFPPQIPGVISICSLMMLMDIVLFSELLNIIISLTTPLSSNISFVLKITVKSYTLWAVEPFFPIKCEN